MSSSNFLQFPHISQPLKHRANTSPFEYSQPEICIACTFIIEGSPSDAGNSTRDLDADSSKWIWKDAEQPFLHTAGDDSFPPSGFAFGLDSFHSPILQQKAIIILLSTH